MIFDKLFGKSEESGVYTFRNNKSDDKPADVCKFESDTDDCSLISQIREKQRQCDKLRAEIKSLESNKQEYTQYTFKFLVNLSNDGINFEHIRGEYVTYFERDRLYYALIYALKEMPDEIFNIFIKELISLRYRTDIISNKKEELRNLGNEIAAIKQQLGIK